MMLENLSLALGHKAFLNINAQRFAVENQVEERISFLPQSLYLSALSCCVGNIFYVVKWNDKAAKKYDAQLHFVYGSFAISNITIFRFQVAAGRRLLRRRCLARIASITVNLFVYQLALLTILAAFDKTLYRLIIFVNVKHTFAAAAARDRYTLLTSTSIRVRPPYFGRRQVVQQTRDRDEKEEKYKDDIEHQQRVEGHELHILSIPLRLLRYDDTKVFT